MLQYQSTQFDKCTQWKVPLDKRHENAVINMKRAELSNCAKIVLKPATRLY